MTDSKSNADVGALVSRIELLEGELQQLKAAVKQQAAGDSAASGGGLTMAALRNMTPEQINARWEEVKSTMKGGK